VRCLPVIAEARLVANFWLRAGDTHSANNILQFLESTLAHLVDKTVGLLRADSGFFDNAFATAAEEQSSTVQEINDNIQKVSDITQSNKEVEREVMRGLLSSRPRQQI
jgi:methyl-accepting chemotaxis protein